MKIKIVVKSFLIITTFMIFMSNANAAELDFCVQTSAIWQLLGYALLAAKIIIPIIIIIFGTIDFSKAVINNKDDNLSKAAGTLLRRICVGVFIFFIPTIVYVIFDMISSASSSMEAAKACNICLTSPRDAECINYKETAAAQRKSQ